MFYSQFILAKKGPLGTIWIAAHLERKLRKNQVADTDIGHSVDSILFPDVPIALRLSSHLLLGVVRIYSRKVNYLFDDCSEALLKVKQAFRSTAVDLPPGESTAPYHSITLPETFDLDDFELPDNDLFQGNFVDHHVSTKEQITLQDTMDGTTYSTSQFGLDERFGDGDTSQIGLDLEEELFSEKVVTPAGDVDSVADPQAASTNVNEDNGDKYNSEPITVDHDENQIGGLGASAEILNCPQTPFTPGLLEEPIDDDFTCDGHLKSDDHNSKELMEIENMEIVPGKLNVEQVKKDGVILSCEKDTSQGPTRDSPLEENGHVLSDVEMNQANSNTITLDGTDSVKNVQDGVINNEKVTHSSDPLDTEMIDSETCMDNSCQRVSGSGAPEGQTDIEGIANAEVSCLPGSLSATDDLCASKSSGKPEHSSDPNTCQGLDILGSPNHGETSSIGVHVLRPCSSHPNQDVMSSQGMADVDVTESSLLDASSKEDVPGTDNQTTNAMKPASEEGHLSDPTVSEVRPDNNSCGEVDNNQNDNPNTSEPSDLPAPEKLLSMPEMLANRPNDLLESTPATEGPVGGDAEHTETTQISGKKRSFTESTLTVQSLNSDESFRVSRSKKTAESIPDDDDLLSSILVGRRSSGLKMKPTPSAPEVASSKRVRSTQRPSTSKRKVLVDDAMVLHGDTIRQQLMSTEDIRRLRKKAPCTRPEILLIQRQFLEDEIFNETIFTGMSGELACLYSGSFDLSRIRVCENVNTISSSEPSKAVESSIRPTATEETEHEDRTEVTTLEKNVEVESETNIQSESHKDIDPDLSSHDTNVTMAVDTCHESLQNQNLGSAMEIETERLSLAVDSEDHSAFHGPDSSSTTVPVAGDHKTEEYLGSGQLGAESISPDRKSNAGVHEHASLEITTSEKEADAIEGAVKNASIQVHGRSEYRAGEEGIELEENKDCAPVDVRADTSSPGMENTSYKIVPPEGGSSDNLVFESNNQPLDEFGAKRLDDANVDIFPTGFPCEDKDKSPSSSLIHGQEPINNLHMVEYQMNVKNDSIKTGECQVCDDTDIQNAMDAESTVINQPVGEHHEDLENVTVENDTEFLNEDDDEVPEEGDGGLNASEEIENSGWSSRTRAVAKYLQNSFYKKSLNGRKALSVDNLVSGKTRKEASRMFFETLVLKTRDYIHVEQAKPLDNIIIKPRVKLMKAEF